MRGWLWFAYMVKMVPILGTLVLIGAIVQILLGFQVAADVQGLRGLHMGLGVLGLALILALVALAFRAKSGTIYSKITMPVLAIIALLQLAMGFQLLYGQEAFVVSHEANGFLILLLSLLTGGITFWSSKKQVTTA